VTLLEEFTAEHPENAAAFYNLACFRLRADDRGGGLDAFRRAFELDPDRVRRWSSGDADLDPIRADVSTITG
jgi:cytochrome c-type biogenesis protein CcmH/NrfG